MFGKMMTVFAKKKKIKSWNKFCGQDAEMVTFVMAVCINNAARYRVKTQYGKQSVWTNTHKHNFHIRNVHIDIIKVFYSPTNV